MKLFRRSRSTFFLIAVLVVALAVLGVVLWTQTQAAARSISGRGIVQPGVTDTLIPIEYVTTVPADDALYRRKGEMTATSRTTVYRNVGQTAVGGKLQPVQTKRVTVRKLADGEEVTFRGTYTLGGPKSVKPTVIYQNDRSFTICGKFETFTRRTAAAAGENQFSVNITTATVQESRYARIFPKGKEVTFTYRDATKFHNANGSWKNPKNRVAIEPADIRANQENITVRGKVTGVNTHQADTVDLGVQCP